MPSLHPTALLLGLLFAVVVALTADRLRALTLSGAISAGIVGTIIFGIGGWLWAAALLTFFGTSSALSRWRGHAKERLGFAKTGRRDAGQVWANGGVATLCTLAAAVPAWTAPAYLLFLAALAAANADTWATEIGATCGGKPYLLTTLRPVSAGTSGAVSVAGIGAALAGAFLMGLFAWPQGTRAVFVVTMAGLAGALFDSLLGATVQAQWRDASDPTRWIERPADPAPPDRGRRWVGNDTVNAFCTLFAVLVAALLTA